MYAFLWRHLPGPCWARVALVLLLLAAIGTALWYAVFPSIDDWLPIDGTVTGPGS